MYWKKRFLLISFIISTIICSSLVGTTSSIDTSQPFFTLTYKAYAGNPYPDYANLVKQQLARIGINVDIVIEDWGEFLDTLLGTEDFDMLMIGFSGGGYDPGNLLKNAFSENASLNCFGYHTSMDWDESLGTGKNEWMINELYNFPQPFSQEQLNHYWEWENYFMDELCPMLPMFAPLSRIIHYDNLEGYNYKVGFKQSWGKLQWHGLHTGQQSINELVITQSISTHFNPFFYCDCGGRELTRYMLDTLINRDSDLTYWPHLVERWDYLSDNHLRLTLREGIKWQNDPDNIFTSEYFDVDDVYFTLYCMKEISNGYIDWLWLEDYYKVDNMTIDLIIENTTNGQENIDYIDELSSLMISPEHYLNQTQLPDGITPDITHPSWIVFSGNPIGTSLFKYKEYKEYEELIFEVNPDCWWLNESITNDEDLNWVERFGDFAHSPSIFRIREIPDLLTSLHEFKAGRVDIEGYSYYNYLDNWIEENNIVSQYKTTNFFNWIGYNMHEARVVIGNRDPAPLDESITIGLAIRKAINYAINREEIKNIMHDWDVSVYNHPNYPSLGKWLNPDIIKYDYNLQLAKEYMTIAGCPLVDLTIKVPLYPLFGLFGIIGVILLKKRSDKRIKK